MILQVAAAAGKRRRRQEQNPHSEKDQHQIESERLWRVRICPQKKQKQHLALATTMLLWEPVDIVRLPMIPLILIVYVPCARSRYWYAKRAKKLRHNGSSQVMPWHPIALNTTENITVSRTNICNIVTSQIWNLFLSAISTNSLLILQP